MFKYAWLGVISIFAHNAWHKTEYVDSTILRECVIKPCISYPSRVLVGLTYKFPISILISLVFTQFIAIRKEQWSTYNFGCNADVKIKWTHKSTSKVISTVWNAVRYSRVNQSFFYGAELQYASARPTPNIDSFQSPWQRHISPASPVAPDEFCLDFKSSKEELELDWASAKCFHHTML